VADTDNIKVGDYVTFKAATRTHYRKATRKVVGLSESGPRVGYHGWPDFIVRWDEIISVDARAA
jgi:hypothetical protein